MLQVYCFYENDVQEAYRKLNVFLAELAAVGVEVPIDHVQSNTKTYPDYGTTATTIDVALEIETQSAYEVMPQVLEAQRRAMDSRVEVPALEVEEKQAPSSEERVSAVEHRLDPDFDPFLDGDSYPDMDL